MRKLFSLLLLLLLLIPALCVPVYADPMDDILAEAAILMDADTGQVLFEKNAYSTMYPASMTKIMTALLVLEACEPSDTMTVRPSALNIDEPESSEMGLQAGEQFTVAEALYGLMLRSANDVANALAEHVSGSQEAFAQAMTERAHAIGAVNTHFSNPHGLHEDDHYTTAYDMALITRHALENEPFRRFFGVQEYEMQPTNLLDDIRSFNNPHQMLREESDYYDSSVIGGKTGYTEEAMRTLTTAATREGRTLITVVMYNQYLADSFADTALLLELGFGEFVPISMNRAMYDAFSVPIVEEGEQVGRVDFTTSVSFEGLIHQSADPASVALVFHHPDAFAPGDEYTSYVTFEVRNDLPGVPTTLGRVDFDPYEILSPRESTFSANPLVQLRSWLLRLRDNVIGLFFVIGGLILVVLLVALAVRKHRLKRRRRIRQQRLRQQRSRIPPAPTPSVGRAPPPRAPQTARRPTQRSRYQQLEEEREYISHGTRR